VKRHRPLAFWPVLVVAAVVAGCNGQGLFNRPAPAEDVEFAKSYLALFGARAFPAIEMGMDPAIRDAQTRQRIMVLASVIPPGEPTSVQLAGSRSTTSGGDSTSYLTFEYQYPDRWVVADVIVFRHNHAAVIKGVQLRPLKEPLERLNRFTFAGKGAAHAIALVAALLVFAFVVWTFVEVLRSPAPALKWAWAIFVLLGVVRFTFNWTTGALNISPLGLQWLGSMFSKPSAFDPLIISTSIPIGAIVYLFQRRDWREDGIIPPPPSSAPPPSLEPRVSPDPPPPSEPPA